MTSISLPQVPEGAVRFLHTSDAQLGQVRSKLGPEAGSRLDTARFEALRKIGELAAKVQASFIVSAGDTFEYTDPTPATLARARNAFAQLPVPIFLLPGNHDALVPGSVLTRPELLELPQVTVLDERRIFSLPAVGGTKVELLAGPYFSCYPSDGHLNQALRELPPAPLSAQTVRIGVGHGQVFSHGHAEDFSGELIDLELLKTAFAEHKLDYCALGDTHSTTDLFAGRLWFSGAPEVTDYAVRPAFVPSETDLAAFAELPITPLGEPLLRPDTWGGEVSSGNVLVVTITPGTATSPSEVSVVPVRSGSWIMEKLVCQLTCSEDIEQLGQLLQVYPDQLRTILRIALTGTLTLSQQQQVTALLEKLAPGFAAVSTWERQQDLQLLASEAELEELALTPYLKQTVTKLQEAPDQELGQAALQLLYRLVKEG